MNQTIAALQAEIDRLYLLQYHHEFSGFFGNGADEATHYCRYCKVTKTPALIGQYCEQARVVIERYKQPV